MENLTHIIQEQHEQQQQQNEQNVQQELATHALVAIPVQLPSAEEILSLASQETLVQLSQKRKAEEETNESKHPKKLKQYEEITEPLQLPIRLRLKHKGKRYWCTLQRVGEDQEVRSVIVDAYQDKLAAEYENLSDAARAVTGLQTANGWKKWQIKYKRHWMCIGRFRKFASKNSRKKDIKDDDIRPSGHGFINPKEDLDPSKIGSTLSPEQKHTVKCLLMIGGKKKMVFIEENKTVGDLLQTLYKEHGTDLCLEMEGYDVSEDTMLSLIAENDGKGKYILNAEVKERALGLPHIQSTLHGVPVTVGVHNVV